MYPFDYIIYFSVLMITACKSEKRMCIQHNTHMGDYIHTLLLSILEQLYRIITPSTSGSFTSCTVTFHKSTFEKQLIVMTKLLHDPNAIYGRLVVPIGVVVGNMTLCTLLQSSVWFLVSSTLSIGAIAYYLQYKLIHSDRNILHELQFAIKRSSEELNKIQGDTFTIDITKLERIRENILEAKKYLSFKLT